jgi:hypothetical protein
MTFCGFDPVNGARFARRLRRSKTIDRVKASETTGFQEVGGAPRQALVAVEENARPGSAGPTISLPAAKAALPLFHRSATGPSGVGRSASGSSADVNGLPRKSLKLQEAPSSKGLTRLDGT